MSAGASCTASQPEMVDAMRSPREDVASII
jgi:hypothetical protein